MNMENEEDYGLEKLFREGIHLDEFLNRVLDAEKAKRDIREMEQLKISLDTLLLQRVQMDQKVRDIKQKCESLRLDQKHKKEYDDFVQTVYPVTHLDPYNINVLLTKVRHTIEAMQDAVVYIRKMEDRIQTAAERCIVGERLGYYCGICETRRPNVLNGCGHVICFQCLMHSHDGLTDSKGAVMRLAEYVDLPDSPENPPWDPAADSPIKCMFSYYKRASTPIMYMFKCPWCRQECTVVKMRAIRL